MSSGAQTHTAPFPLRSRQLPGRCCWSHTWAGSKHSRCHACLGMCCCVCCAMRRDPCTYGLRAEWHTPCSILGKVQDAHGTRSSSTLQLHVFLPPLAHCHQVYRPPIAMLYGNRYQLLHDVHVYNAYKQPCAALLPKLLFAHCLGHLGVAVFRPWRGHCHPPLGPRARAHPTALCPLPVSAWVQEIEGFLAAPARKQPSATCSRYPFCVLCMIQPHFPQYFTCLYTHYAQNTHPFYNAHPIDCAYLDGCRCFSGSSSPFHVSATCPNRCRAMSSGVETPTAAVSSCNRKRGENNDEHNRGKTKRNKCIQTTQHAIVHSKTQRLQLHVAS